MKAPNGTGTITKLTGNRRKPYMVRLPAKKGRSNRVEQGFVGYFESYDDAQKALLAYRNAPAEASKITLLELWDEWKLTRAYTELSTSTQNNYNAAWKKRLCTLGTTRVRDIRIAHLQKVIDDAQAEGKSHSSLTKDKLLMSLLYTYAMQNDITQKNLAQFVRLPTNEEVSKKDAFTDLELAKVEKTAADGVPFADVILILCYTGLRIQELLNLTPFSYDPVQKTLTGGLKTAAGKGRVVPLHPKIAGYVQAWYDKGGVRIICKDDGSAYNQKYFREKCYAPALEQIGFREERRLPPHCCRHTFATLMYRKGIGDKERELLMGHTDIKMTMQYTHSNLEELKKAVASL